MTRADDVWCCEECGKEQGRHDQFFDGICQECHNRKEKHNDLLKVEFQKKIKLKMRKGK